MEEAAVHNLTKNFSYEELQCPCCGEMQIEMTFLDTLQEIRDAVGRPFVLSSGYRCKEHNFKIGGASTSRHLYGCAVDILTAGWSSDDLHYLMFELTSVQNEHYDTGIGIYKRHIHFDFRESSESLWVNL